MNTKEIIDHWKDYINDLKASKAGSAKLACDMIDSKIKGVEFCIRTLRGVK